MLTFVFFIILLARLRFALKINLMKELADNYRLESQYIGSN